MLNTYAGRLCNRALEPPWLQGYQQESMANASGFQTLSMRPHASTYKFII
jgi:hypothetical protein